MATVDELIVQIDASTELLRRELARGSDAVQTFEKTTGTHLNALHNRFQTVFGKIRGLFGLFGVSFGVRAFAGWIEGATKAEKLTVPSWRE